MRATLQKANAETWKRRSQHGGAAATKRQPERAEETRQLPPHEVVFHKIISREITRRCYTAISWKNRAKLGEPRRHLKANPQDQ